MRPEFLERLRKEFRGEVSNKQSDLAAASIDASLFRLMPKLVVHPLDSADLKLLVQLVAVERAQDPTISLTARSGGTDMSGGPLTESIVVDMTSHFNHFGPVGHHSAVTEPGVYYRDFEKATLAQGLLLPSYPASKEICTVGGMVSNNSGGEKSLKYGKTASYIEELSVVLADGHEYAIRALSPAELAKKEQEQTFEGQAYRELRHLIEANLERILAAKPRVTKNSAGYALWDVWDGKRFDLTRLFCGAQGTLGFVTKAKLKLIQPNPVSQLLIMFLHDLEPIGDIVNEVMKFEPESFESYDDHTLTLALRFLPSMIKHMKGNALTLGFRFLPELFMVIRGGVPKLVLIAEFTGKTPAEVSAHVAQVQAAVREKFKIPTRIARTPQDAAKYWTVRRESFNLLRQHTHGLATAPFIDDVVVRPEQLSTFLPRLNAIVSKYPELMYTIAGHAGDANFHIIPLVDLKNPKVRDIIPKVAEEVYHLVLEYQGSITGEHNDGLIRTPYLVDMFGAEMCQLFLETKRIFDPQGVFNPHKKVGGDLAYTFAHLKTS